MTTPESCVIGSKVFVGLKDDGSSNNTSRTSSIISLQDTTLHCDSSHDTQQYPNDSNDEEEYQPDSTSDSTSDEYEYGYEYAYDEEEEEHDSGFVVPRISVQEGNERLRILVCGDSGIGKTRLIRTALTPNLSAPNDNLNKDDGAEPEPILSEDGFTIYSNQDILFVDTPGYGACINVQYMFVGKKGGEGWFGEERQRRKRSQRHVFHGVALAYCRASGSERE